MTEHLEDNEAFYDEKIAPLMAQIIALCKERDIPHVCCFQIQGKDFNDGDPLLCSTTRIDPKNTVKALLRAFKEIRQKPEIFTMTIVTGPANK